MGISGNSRRGGIRMIAAAGAGTIALSAAVVLGAAVANADIELQQVSPVAAEQNTGSAGSGSSQTKFEDKSSGSSHSKTENATGSSSILLDLGRLGSGSASKGK